MADKQTLLDRFRKVVDRKSDEAERASHNPGADASGNDKVNESPQQTLVDPGTPQDVASARDKNTRHGKVTADKWNQ